MQSSNAPAKLVLPFANAGAKNDIPVDSQIGVTPGAASLVDGFPPLTGTPIESGGVPPSRLDMNGALYEISAIARWVSAGGSFTYDPAFASDTNVGGYPAGAVVLRADGTGFWINTTNNNTTDPESAGAAAAGWRPGFTSGGVVVNMTNANVTLTPTEYGCPVIIVTGSLTANVSLIFPTFVTTWTIINLTTGSYTITARTVSGSGAVVTGVSSVVCDGTNITGLTRTQHVWESTQTFRSPGDGTKGGVEITANSSDTVGGVLQFTNYSRSAQIGYMLAYAGTLLAFGVGTTERLRLGSSGQIGLSGANYGIAGEVLISGGPSGAAVWGNAPMLSLIKETIYRTSSTWTADASGRTRIVEVIAVGGGGGGGNASGSNSLGVTGGGAGGGTAKWVGVATSPQAVTVGAGGAAQTTGGASSFGAYATGNGGGGASGYGGGLGATGTVASGGTIFNGTSGGSGGLVGSSFSGFSGASGGGSYTGAGAPGSSGNGVAASLPGAGGGGGAAGSAGAWSVTGGAGAAGMVIVREYA